MDPRKIVGSEFASFGVRSSAHDFDHHPHGNGTLCCPEPGPDEVHNHQLVIGLLVPAVEQHSVSRRGERRGVDEDEQHQECADDRCDTKTFRVSEQQHEHAEPFDQPRPEEHFADSVDMRVFVGIPRVGAHEREEVVVHDMHRPDHPDHENGHDQLHEYDPLQSQSIEAGHCR